MISESALVRRRLDLGMVYNVVRWEIINDEMKLVAGKLVG